MRNIVTVALINNAAARGNDNSRVPERTLSAQIISTFRTRVIAVNNTCITCTALKPPALLQPAMVEARLFRTRAKGIARER